MYKLNFNDVVVARDRGQVCNDLMTHALVTFTGAHMFDVEFICDGLRHDNMLKAYLSILSGKCVDNLMFPRCTCQLRGIEINEFSFEKQLHEFVACLFLLNFFLTKSNQGWSYTSQVSL